MAAPSDRLYVTYVDAYHGLLKIWGQPNRTCATYVEKQLLQLVPEFNRSPGLSPSIVRKGMLCFAKYEDDSYYRARIISDVVNNSVLVYFIDYGNKDRIDLNNIRVLSNTGDSIITTIIPQAEEYYLANIRAEQGWSQDIMTEIRRGLCYSEYKYRTVCQSGNDKLIQISYRNEDYSSFLIRQDLAKPVSVKEQMLLLKSTFRGPSMDPIGGAFRSSGFGHLPQPSSRDAFFMPNKLPIGPVPPEFSNPSLQVNPQPMLPQSVFPQPQTRGGIVSGDRHLGLTPSQKVMFSQMGQSPMYQEGKSPPVLNNVVIEALANQLKHHLMKDSITPAPETPTSGYISQVLDVKTTHNVYISYIDDGPWSFSVQLVSNENELNQLMDDLGAYNFQPIKLPLVLGSPCIAKSKQFENYCRGVLVNITHSAVKVFYVDFGNTEDLPVNMLFEMPAKFFKVKTMSQKFALSGLQRIKPTEEIKKAFIEVVENELLILHVTNLEGESLPTCDLYLKDVNIKRILNEKLRQVKNWEPTQFPRVGEIENVFVTHVESAQKFYVQLKRHETELKDLKDELANLGTSAEHFNPEEIVPGIICISLFAADKNWYRATVTSVDATVDNFSKTAKIFYIDYGNTEEVDFKMLKKVGNHAITKVSTQAIPCSLQGFENESSNPSIKAALGNLIFEKEFSMKVVSDEKDHIIVQLFDNGKDMSMCLKDATNVKQNPSEGDTKDNTDNRYPESDVDIKRSNLRSSPTFGNENEYDRADASRSRVRRDFRDDRVSWRSDDSRKDFGWKNRDDGKIMRSREIFEVKNDRYDSGRSARYGFKPKIENINPMDRETRNWRGTPENFGTRNYGGDIKNKPKIGETLTARMKRAARENEERGLHLNEATTTKVPVRLENIAFHGHHFQKKKVKIGSTEDVIVTYFVNPSEIYVQLVSSRDKFRDFMTDIHDYYSTKLPLLNNPKKGDVVVSKFQQDGVLYRAVVIETDPITVRYVDFGNEEISEKDNLWPMDKKFLKLEIQCLKCTLSGIKPIGSDTWPPPNSDMDKIFEHESYKCTFIKKLDHGYEVKMVISQTGADVNDELISGGFAYSVKKAAIENPNNMLKDASVGYDLICNEIFNVFITHLVDASEFYLQIKSSKLNSLGQEILEYALKEKLLSPGDRDKLNEGDLCLVKADSGDWCRAKVIEKREIKIIVRLIDYGEELSIGYERVMPISDDIAKYPPQAIQCSLSIDKNAQCDEFLAEFSRCNKNSFSALFHEVSDQRFKVALYDEDGEKLEILESDTLAPKYVRPIAELPLINRKMLVKVSHIQSPKDIYVQLLNDATDLTILSGMMPCHSLKEDCEEEEKLSEYELYAVFSVSHRNWYRAQLMSQGDKLVKMFYIDVGLNEEVPKKNVRKLNSSFYKNYAFAKKVSLNINYEDDAAVYITEKLKRMIAEKECTGYFVKVNNVIYAEFSIDDTLLTPQLVSGSVTELMVDLFKSYTPKSSEKSLKKVIICYVVNPGKFWVQEETKISELNALQEKLQNACWDELTKADIAKGDIAKGDIVGVLFTDCLWYRALVSSVEGDIVTVYFMDYGNNFKIDKREKKYVLLNEELKKPPPFAWKCSLKGRWEVDATFKFNNIAMNYEDAFTLIQISDKNDTVDLLRNGSSVTEQLINEGYGEKYYDDIVLITHVNSPDDFYIQKASDKGLFEMISTEILKANSFEDAVDIHMDEIYCVKYPKDDLWYRAKVLKKEEDNVFVKFIDYGNCSSITTIKQLPPDLKTPHPLATNCRLVKEKPNDTWSEAACIAFEKYVNIMLLKMEIVEQESGIDTVLLFTENEEDLTKILVKANKDVATTLQHELVGSEITLSSKDDTSSNHSVSTGSIESSSSRDDEGGEDETSDRNSDETSVKTSDENSLKTSEISNQAEELPKCTTEKIVPGRMSLGEKPIKDDKKDDKGSAKKLPCWEEIAPGCVSRGPSLEEVSSAHSVKKAEKLKKTSVSAPVTPSISKRDGQAYKKFEREIKLLSSSLSRGKLPAESKEKISDDEEGAGANVNGN